MNRAPLAIGLAATILVVVVACRTAKDEACNVDTDCETGSFCREGFCASLTSDGGADGQAPTACVSPGQSCAIDSDCCSPPCNNGRCAGASTSGRPGGGSSGTSGTSGASGTSGTSGTSGSTCQDIYALCSGGDCCVGLSCTDGVCR